MVERTSLILRAKGGLMPPFKLALVLGGLIAIGALAPLLIVGPFSLRSGTQFVALARDGAAASASSYRRPLGNDPETLDPARISDTYGRSVAQQIFDGLVQLDQTLATTDRSSRASKEE